MRYLNYIIFAALVLTLFVLKGELHLSTNLLGLFASKESAQKVHIATELGYTRDMMIAIKGFEKDSQRKVQDIVKKLHSLESIESVEYRTTPAKEVQEYYKKYFALLSDFNNSTQTKEGISKKLQGLYDSQKTSFFYTPIDRNDPLGLFRFSLKQQEDLKSRHGYLTLGDYGYLIRVKTAVSPSDMEGGKTLYKEVHAITDGYKDVIAFAGSFYTVENSQKIKEDITKIVVISTLLLFMIYLVFLRNFRLLFHTSLALISSMLFALIISTSVYEDFHVISMAFGMSVSAVSIDYLFHYYFHNFYKSKKKMDANVFYGYLTTTVAFGIFSFIPVTLIAQISFFTALSLTFSYLIFTFVFPSLNFVYKEQNHTSRSFAKLPSSLVLVVSILLLVYVASGFKLDNNIRNLDYQNLKLQAIENTFKTQNKQHYTPVIVEAKTKEELIEHLHTLQDSQSSTFSLASFILQTKECEKRKRLLDAYDFAKLRLELNQEANKIGFKQGYFENAYTFAQNLPKCGEVDPLIFKSYNLSIVEDRDKYYSLALIKDPQKAIELPYVGSVDLKAMFEKVSKQMYKDIEYYCGVVLGIILLLIFLSVKRKFFYAFNYIFFPTLFTLSILVSFYEINIMHLFGLIILIAIGIDYGIYMSNTQKRSVTMLAIKYSLLSTFAAFGVLVFSSITALNSIGLVLSLGSGAIFILTKVMK